MTRTLLRRAVTGPAATQVAVLVDGPRVAWVGADDAASDLPADEEIDLGGCWVAPAFVDAHVHATSTGLALDGLDLTAAPSLAAALDMVQAAARRARGAVVLGTGWDETRWPERRAPTARELDRASYGGVVYLSRTDVHSAVASSALLAAVPEVREAVGVLPDGLVQRDAHHLVRAAAFRAVSPSQRRAAQQATRLLAAENGVACLHECGGPHIGGEDDFLALLELAREEPGPEVVGYWGELGGADRARELGALGAAGDLFVDGAIGSRTACLRERYTDADSSGYAYVSSEQVAEHVAQCTRVGMQAGFHAIGDAALDLAMAGFAAAARQVGVDAVRACRHRVEHVEMLDASHIATMAALGLVASVQPAFDERWGGQAGMYAERLGERAVAMNPLAALHDAGVRLAFGSDAPVTPIDPWAGVRAAVGHRTPGSGLAAAVAFAAHTEGGWHATGRDEGRAVEPGSLASLAAWEVPGGLDPDGLPTGLRPGRCRLTMVSGTVVHRAG